MKKILFSTVTSLILSSGFVYADNIQSVGADIGTIGIDADYTTMIMPQYNLALRVSTGGFKYSGEYDDTDTHYDTDMSLFNLGATLEYHPFANGWYVGLGAYYQNSNYEFDAKDTNGFYEFNGHSYEADKIGGVYGKIKDLNHFVPYLGFGYDTSLLEDDTWFFTFKAGAWYQGKPRLELTVHDCQLGPGCMLLEEDVAKEEDDINEDIKDYKWWPVIQIGVSYRF